MLFSCVMSNARLICHVQCSSYLSCPMLFSCVMSNARLICHVQCSSHVSCPMLFSFVKSSALLGVSSTDFLTLFVLSVPHCFDMPLFLFLSILSCCTLCRFGLMAFSLQVQTSRAFAECYKFLNLENVPHIICSVISILNN